MRAAVAAGTTLALEDVAGATGGRLVAGASTGEIAGVSIDSRTVGRGELFVAVRGPRFDGHDFVAEAAQRGAAAALVHRDVDAPPGLAVLRVDDTTRALGALARQVRLAADIPVVAITGSTGKTTTKEITAALLGTRGPVLKTEGNLNNQYGLPLTLLKLRPEHTAAVLELGMSAAGELRGLTSIARPDLALITNVAPVHLEFFDSVEAIAAAKAEILEGLGPDGVAVLNHDDARVRRIGGSFGGRVVWFGRDRACEVSGERWRGTAHGMRFDLRVGGVTVDVALGLAGPHDMMNFLAAAAAAHRLGVDPGAIATAAPSIRPAPHRGEVLRLARSVTLIDDSYNSNPVAVEAAVVTLGMTAHRRRVAFLGDMLELGPEGPALHAQVGETIAPKVDAIAAVGPLAAHFLDGARKSGLPEDALRHFPDSTTAAAAAPELVLPGDAVLVKGSRGARMERIVEALVSHFGARPDDDD
jgi:UDP-N-acetylmuramoyl-tripeptide--D-alanyl-D-alanine ligase